MSTESLRDQSSREERARGPSRQGAIRHPPIHAWRPPFDAVTRGLHWATAFLVLAMFATAWLHALADEQESAFTPFLLQIHRSIGWSSGPSPHFAWRGG